MKKTSIFITIVLIVAQQVFAQVLLSHSQKTPQKHQDSKAKICCPFSISNEKLNFFKQDIDSNKNKLNDPPTIVQIVAPDTMVLPDIGSILDTVFVQVSDPDSIDDVDSVWFYSLRPDSQTIGPFNLQNIGTGMFFLVFQLNASNDQGVYTWTFTARDLAGNLSDPVIHYITIIDSIQLYINTEKTVARFYELSQNYPNPFNPTTMIKYTLPKSEKIKIEIFNLIGQKIETLFNKYVSAGSHEIEFTAKDLPSGVYLYKISAGKFQQFKKMIILK